MSNQSLQPNLPQEKIKQILLDKFEEDKKAIRDLSDEELLSVIGSGGGIAGAAASGTGRTGWNILSGVSLALVVPAIFPGFGRAATKAT